MRNIFLITKREYLTQVKKKSFVILTILAPLLMVAFGVFIAFLFKANEAELNIQVIDKSGIFVNQLKSSNEIKYSYASASSEKQIIAKLEEIESIDGLLIIGKKTNNQWAEMERNSELLMKTKIGFDAKNQIINDLSQIIRKKKITNLNLTTETIDDLDSKFNLKAKNIKEEKSVDSDLDFSVKYGLGVGLMYVTFMFIMMYGVRVMRSVLEEKNNRVVEIIISSVKPFELMLGKIIGVTLVALTQFSIWIFMSVASALILNSKVSHTPIPVNDAMENLNTLGLITNISSILLKLNYPLIIFIFIFFFIFGYIFYSSIYAAIGSAVDNETETQQFTLFAIIPLMVGMYGSFTIVNNPDGPLGFWLSIIPFTSPVAMVARIPFGVPVWEILLSIVLLVTSSIFMIFVAGKVYRVGILMYGNKASLKEIIKWIKS